MRFVTPRRDDHAARESLYGVLQGRHRPLGQRIACPIKDLRAGLRKVANQVTDRSVFNAARLPPGQPVGLTQSQRRRAAAGPGKRFGLRNQPPRFS